MRHGIFVTGGTGFVGRRVLAALSGAGMPIHALARARPADPPPTGVQWVTGDLLQPHSYQEALASCDTVLHLAAATGRATAEEHRRVNALGTDRLVDASRRAGVSRMLLVSSIATTFPDLRGYHYAQAKVRAEESVQKSGLRFAILRPTIILGPGAPILGALEKLATLPVMTLPGSGRARVQPIHVDDVARAIVAVVDRGRFDNAVFEIGGPEILTIEELVRRLRLARTGRAGRVIHVPLWLIGPPLRVAEAAGLGRALPLTAGQLSSFQWDGVASGNALQDLLAPTLTPVSRMLEAPGVAAAAVGAPAPGALDAECRVFTRHVLGCAPDVYVMARYADAHTRLPGLTPVTGIDRVLLAAARLHPWSAKAADAFAAAFVRSSVLRRKLVLLLAILETHAPFYQTIDRAYGHSPASTAARLAGISVIALASLALAILVLPLGAAASLMSRERR